MESAAGTAPGRIGKSVGTAAPVQHLDLLHHQLKPRVVYIVTAFHSRTCRLCIAYT